MNTITLSVEELNRLIDERVQTALANNKPVRDKRMKELEMYLRSECEKNKISDRWYSIWTTVRTSVAMHMGYGSASKVPPSRYDELLAAIKTEVTAVLEALKRKEETR